jgi:hypothetical protein
MATTALFLSFIASPGRFFVNHNRSLQKGLAAMASRTDGRGPDKT